MKTGTFLRTFMLYSLLGISCKSFCQKADLIFTNGKIFTADARKLYVQALAIKGNKILATGSNAKIQKLASSKTKQIDLKGKTMIPGINDQHDHSNFQSPAPLRYETTDALDGNWDGLPKSAILDSIAKLLPKAISGEWITGIIGNRALFDTTMRRSLDSIAPNNPVVLQTWWGHGLVTNQRGVEAAGLRDDAADPLAGWYGRNGEGKITAVQENAEVPFWWAASKAYLQNASKLMEAYGQEQLKGGITSTLFFGSGFSYSTVTQLLSKANIPQRLRIVPWIRTTAMGRQVAEWPVAETHPTPKSTVSGMKYVVNHFGPLLYPADTLKEMLRESLTTKQQLMMHISGDSAFNVVLELIKVAGTASQWRPLRCRIEHNMIGNPTNEQRRLLREYGILVMHTPKYNHGSPLHSLLNDGIIVGLSPDGTTNPFWDIMQITAQQKNPNENITREQAVIAYTKTNAYAEFKEKEKGMLKKGMLADLVVLSQDMFTIPVEQLPATVSILTMVDGKLVYEK